MQKQNKLLSIGEAAEYLNVSIDTLRRWEKRGKIEPLRSPGNHRYFSVTDLDKLFGKRYQHDNLKEKKFKLPKPEKESTPIKTFERETEKPKQKTDSLSYASITYPILESIEKIPVFERPVRDIKIPEVKLIRIISAEEKVISENTLNVIQKKEVVTGILTPASLSQVVKEKQNIERDKNTNISITEVSKTNTSNLIFYITILLAIVIFIGFVFFIIGASTQEIISPVP